MEEVRREGSKVVVEVDARIYDYKSVVEAARSFDCPAKVKKELSSFTVILKPKDKSVTVGYEFYNFLLDRVKERKVM